MTPRPAPGRRRVKVRRGLARITAGTTPIRAPRRSDTTMSVKENPPRSNAPSATSTQAGWLLSENLKFGPNHRNYHDDFWVRGANTCKP